MKKKVNFDVFDFKYRYCSAKFTPPMLSNYFVKIQTYLRIRTQLFNKSYKTDKITVVWTDKHTKFLENVKKRDSIMHV